ncbi:flagellar hook-associated protein FlgK [Pengzhenrongella sp.]|uniref:flagellar hook-associated protein FlgK n=1 Tax=Pengzhenrongella sp. TaxID=2888820 RepID=UPI002F9437B9
MSTFSGLSTALSSLIAQRQALEVAGQNVANANTVGYTRQRADLATVSANLVPALWSSPLTAGNGVQVTSITRMGDVFLDARLRAETGGASFAAAKAEAYSRLESTVAEPGELGVANALQEFWAGWQDVGNDPGSKASRSVLLEDATALAKRINAGHAAVTTQWSQTRTELDSAINDVNTGAGIVAGLNKSIRGVIASGGSPNELIDQRNVVVMKLSALVGASATQRDDGTIDVSVDGNPLVRGENSFAITVNPTSYTMGQPVTLSWAGTPYPLNPASGSIAGMVAALAPTQVTGNGGILAEAAASYDVLATTLITQVNAQHALAVTAGGAAGGAFFTSVGPSSAATLSVAITDGADIAVGKPGGGVLDGSMADPMSELGKTTTGPDSHWSDFVVGLGVTSRSATQRATITESTRSTAEGLQMSNASVDIDEESTNMLASQRAYEGAARVLTAIDSMLDTLINRTGLVGRS